MSTSSNGRKAANKVNAPATQDNAIANATPTPEPAPAPAEDATPAAADIAALAANWLAAHKSIKGIKSVSASLIAEHGGDLYKAVLSACKATRAAEITTYHASAKRVIAYDAVLEREFAAIKGDAGWSKWVTIIAAKWSTASEFVAACYPHVTEDGKPAKSVSYTNGTTIYKAYRAISWATSGGALVVLEKSLETLKAATIKAANNASDAASETARYNKTHKAHQPFAAYDAKTIKVTDAKGVEYAKLVAAGAANIKASELAAISVRSAGKDGQPLPTLADFNAALRK